MSRNPFGWDLPPGVTNRMIEEAAGGDPEAEAFFDAFQTEYENINDGTQGIDTIMEKMGDWVWTQICNSYTRGYKQGQSDELYAQQMKTERDEEIRLSNIANDQEPK
jgi:hypothetical protein